MSVTRDPVQVPDERALAELAALIRDHRQAVLATLDAGAPYVAMLAYVPEPDFSACLIHLSDLAAHKRHLRADPHCALLIFEPDDGRREILQHRRVSIACRGEIVPKHGPEYEAGRERYLAALPMHRLMFGLTDFDLVRLVPVQGLLNAGFGRAFRLTPDDLAAAARR
jgi:putative heme iron utilization protein